MRLTLVTKNKAEVPLKQIPVYVGVDAGGTKTRLAAADASGSLLLHRVGAGANLSLLGPEKAADRLLELLSSLPHRLKTESLVVGIAGAASENLRTRLQSILSHSLHLKNLLVLNDAVAVLRGLGTGKGNRLLLAVGTGTVAFGLDSKDRLYRVDGWGPLAGDAGSGHWIGRKALETALASHDGRKRPSLLTRLVLEKFHIHSPEAEIFKLYQNPPSQAQVADLALDVLKAARRGDREAKDILASASQALTLSLRTLLRRMPPGESHLMLTGSLASRVPELLEGIKKLERGSKSRLKLHTDPLIPEAGALFLAYGLAGKTLSPTAKPKLVKRLQVSVPQPLQRKSLPLPITEASNPATTRFSFLKPLEMVRLMNQEDLKVAPAVGQVLPAIAKAVSLVEKGMKTGGRLIYVGAGTSGRLGILDASEVPPTFGLPPNRVVGVIAGGPKAITQSVEGAEDRADWSVAEIRKLKVGSKDTVVGLSVSGGAAFVLGALQEAKRRRAKIIGITCNPASLLSKAVDLPIVVPVGPEVLTGSSRLKAGTAQKMVLNILTTCVMARLGFVTGNLMTRVATTNQKLRNRAIRITAETLRITESEAKSRLEKAGWKIQKSLL